jgi:hypothetical protein
MGGSMMSKHWISISAIALVHFVACFIFFSISFGASMRSFDSGLPPTLSDKIFGALFAILSFPIATIAMSIPSGGRVLRGVLGWIPFISNSVLWGIGLSWLIGKYVQIRNR